MWDLETIVRTNAKSDVDAERQLEELRERNKRAGSDRKVAPIPTRVPPDSAASIVTRMEIASADVSQGKNRSARDTRIAASSVIFLHAAQKRNRHMPIPTGLNLRRENLHILNRDNANVTGVELTFDRIDDPLRVAPYLGGRNYAYVGVHALKLSLASPELPPQAYLESLRAIALENGAASVSDHLGFTRVESGGVEIAHFAPPPYCRAALDATCRNVEYIQSFLGDLDFYVENIAYPFCFNAEMDELEFVARMLQRTGCGWLLDVHNVYANARNHGYDARQFIRTLAPLTDRIEIHLAGGYYDPASQLYIDSHTEPVPDETWDLYRYALRLAGDKVRAVFIERDSNFPTDDGWTHEVGLAARIAAEEVQEQPR